MNNKDPELTSSLGEALSLVERIVSERNASLQSPPTIITANTLRDEAGSDAIGMLINTPTGPQLLPVPLEIAQKAFRPNDFGKHADLESFCNYVNRFKNDTTIIRASTEMRMCAEIDYIPPGGDPRNTQKGGLATAYGFKPDPLFTAWKHALSESVTYNQTALAEFLEEVEPTVIVPDAADLRSMVLNLSQMRQVKFQSKINVSNGQVNFAYSDEDNGNQTIALPERIRVSLPVALNRANNIEMDIALRYRISSDGEARFRFSAPRLAQLVNAWWLSEIETVERLTDVPVYLYSNN